jgi:hypothetical protein
MDSCGTGVCGGRYDTFISNSAGGGGVLRRGDSDGDFGFTYRNFWDTLPFAAAIAPASFLEVRYCGRLCDYSAGLAGDPGKGAGQRRRTVIKLNKNLKKLTLCVVFLVQLFLCQGCNIFGFLATPGPFEKGVTPDCDLKPLLKQKTVFVWAESLPGSGADAGVARQLNQAILTQLRKKAGISEKSLLTQAALHTAVYDRSQTPAALGRQAGADLVLYVRLEEFEVINLHGDKIYSGQMLARAILIDSQTEKIVCPAGAEGIVADVATDLSTVGREDMVMTLSAAAAHCIVRHFYTCPKNEYRVNEERSTLNEMIQEDVN